MIGSCLPLDKSMVPEPDQLPANWLEGAGARSRPLGGRALRVASAANKNKIVTAKRPRETSRSAGFECMDIIEIPSHLGTVLVDPTTRSTHLGSPMEQPGHRG